MFSVFKVRPGVVALALCAGLASCQSLNSSRVSVDYYAISGNTTAALDREILAKGPRINGGRHAVAVARIRIIPNIRYVNNDNGCQVSRAKVNVDAKVTLPRWTGRANATKELGKAWDNIDRYTRLHEGVHVAIAFRSASAIEKAVKALPRYKRCEDLKAQVRQLINTALEDHDRKQRQFDADEQKRLAAFARARREKQS
ncbi:MAG: DUF922 domain-containing protein [Pseudomonadota bacterium]